MRWPSLALVLVFLVLTSCGGGSNSSESPVSGSGPPSSPAQTPGSAPESEEPAPEPGRLDFLLHRDSTRACLLDSAFDPKDWGKGPFDPPYVPGENRLVVLADVDGDMRIEQAIPLRDSGVVYVFSLSPDGDGAVAAAFVDPGYELIFVRGLRTGDPVVSHRLGWDPEPAHTRQPASIAFSPDGTWVAVGTAEHWSEEVGIQIVTGLPEEPVLAEYIDLESEPGIIGNPGVHSIDISLDGTRILAKKVFDDCTDPGKSRAEVQVVDAPQGGAVAVVHPPLVLPQDPAIPATAPWEGQPTGVAMCEAGLMPDGDTAVVPCFGWALSQPDARIFLVRGIRSGTPRIERTLGPEDGVARWPKGVSVCPDGDRALVANLLSGTVSLLSGLSSVTLETVEVKTTFQEQVAGYADVTPDGRFVLIANGQGPVDNSPPPRVTSHRFADGALHPTHADVTGAIHIAPFWPDDGFATWSPGLSDYVDAFLPGDFGTSLLERIDRAARLADEGRDGEARAALDGFRDVVAMFLAAGELAPYQAQVLDALARLGQGRLRP